MQYWPAMVFAYECNPQSVLMVAPLAKGIIMFWQPMILDGVAIHAITPHGPHQISQNVGDGVVNRAKLQHGHLNVFGYMRMRMRTLTVSAYGYLRSGHLPRYTLLACSVP